MDINPATEKALNDISPFVDWINLLAKHDPKIANMFEESTPDFVVKTWNEICEKIRNNNSPNLADEEMNFLGTIGLFVVDYEKYQSKTVTQSPSVLVCNFLNNPPWQTLYFLIHFMKESFILEEVENGKADYAVYGQAYKINF
jgi:hypothetical protein